MNETASIPAFYWSRKEHPSGGLPDVQYATLWLFPTGRFRFINCWPGYAWFSASGTREEQDGQLHCQGNSRGWSDGFADNHSNRDYIACYIPSEDRQQLVPDKTCFSPLTKVSQDTVDLFFSHLDERDFPQSWRNFRELVWKIERHLGIKTPVLGTFLIDRGSV
jgi:hypothetical protein